MPRFYRIAETLPDEVLTKMYAPPKPAYPVLAPADIANFDAFLMGIPTRFGNFPTQWKVRDPSSHLCMSYEGLTRRV